jgi:TPR repeat protein
MKLKTTLTALFLSLSLMSITYADYYDGLDAYNKGDYKTAFSEWKPLADQGDERAQFNIGWAYEHGKGVLKDYKQAVKWYRKAADQGHAGAQNNLAGMYFMGTGVLKSMTQAKYWTQKAYEGDDKEATALAEKNLDDFELWKY